MDRVEKRTLMDYRFDLLRPFLSNLSRLINLMAKSIISRALD